MASHRYWRLAAITTAGAASLELSELGLFDGAATRLDGGATLSCSETPSAGTLGALTDGAYGVSCIVPATMGLSFTWDFGGTEVDVLALRFGAGASQSGFIASYSLLCSDDGTSWLVHAFAARVDLPATTAAAIVSWPGANQPANVSLVQPQRDDTFAASPPTGSWASVGAGGTVVWSSGGQLLTITIPNGTQGFFIFPALGYTSAWPAMPGCSSWIEFDTILTADSFAQRHTGVFMGNTVTNTGYRVAGYGTTIAWTKWPAITDPGGTLYAADSNPWNVAFGTTLTTRVERSTDDVWSVYVGGTLVFQGKDPAGTFAASTMFVGIFGYGVTLQLLAVRSGVTGPSQDLIAAGLSKLQGQPQVSSSPEALLVEQATRDLRNIIRAHVSGVTGRGRIVGTVKNKGSPENIPVYRRVRLQRQADGAPVDELWSDPVTGSFEFQDLDADQKYVVTSYDHTGSYRGVIAAEVTPAL